MKSVSVVIPVLNEEETVDELVSRLRSATKGLAYAFEFVVVDDGSTDGTLDKLLAWQEKEPRLTVVKLTRNWGHQNAFNAGLDYAEASDAVVLMDGDLQDPPEMIPALLEKWREGSDVVYTVKEKRADGWLRRFLTSLYYRLIRLVGEVKIEKQAGMFSLIDKAVVSELRRFTERNKSYPNLRTFVGFKQTRVSYRRQKRLQGKPKQTLWRLVNDGLNAVFSFSYVPMRVVTIVGLFMTLVFAFLFLLVLFLRITSTEFWIFGHVPGWTSAILLILSIGSFNIVFLGIVGEYIARILDEVRQRPYYIVKAVYKPGADKDR